MFEVKTEQELIDLLRVISEEAVSLSRKTLSETEDGYAETLMSMMRKDPLLEQEEEDEEAEEVAADTLPEPEPEPEPETEEPPMPAKEKAMELSSEDFGVSFDSVMTAINTLRAGRSLKDTAIRDEASAYYDRLTDDERKVLLIFLREFSKILTGAIQGSDAIDPSDPPLGIKISKTEPEKPKAPTPQAKPAAPAQTKRSAEAEDTSPPIRVNESQDLLILREKVRKLMNS